MTSHRPLSPVQHGVWFTDLMQPVGTAYHLALRVTFTGPLDTARLAAACDAVVARHPVLATAVRLIDGEAALVPVPAPALRPVIGAAALAEELARPFALDTGPLCRFALDSTDPGRHVLLVVAHHLVFDGTSKDLLLADLAAAYRGEELPPLPGPGPDPFGPQLEPARAYWRTAWQEPAEVLLPGEVTVAEPAARAEVLDVPIDARLGATLSAVADTLGATELRAHLAARLPEAMVPTGIAVFDTMPLTANGKLDHTAIAEAATARPAAAPPPRTDRPAGGTPDEAVTEQVRAIWAEVLGVPDVGPDDDLFDLGGHSLTITQIAARMRRRLGIDLPLHAFYDAPTVSGVLAVAGR